MGTAVAHVLHVAGHKVFTLSSKQEPDNVAHADDLSTQPDGGAVNINCLSLSKVLRRIVM